MGAPTCTGYTGAEIYQRVNAQPGAWEDLAGAADEIGQAKQAYGRVGHRIGEMQTKLAAVWSGSGADMAAGGMSRAMAAVNAALTNFESTKGSLDNQSFAFGGVKSNVVRMDQSRPDDQGITDYLSIGASDAEKAAAQWDTDNRHNIEWYDRYNSSTTPNQTQLPPAYRHVTDAPSSSAPPAQQVAPATGGDSGGLAGTTGGSTSATRRGSAGVSRPGTNRPYVAPAGVVPPPHRAAAPGAPPHSVDQATQTSGYTPPERAQGSGNGTPGTTGFGPGGSSGSDRTSGFGPGTGFGVTGGFGSGGGSGATGGYGSGGPSGRGGSGGFSGRAAGAEMSGGRQVGSGPASEGGATRAGGTAGTSAASGRGTAGMGGPMAGANRGEGAEDSEHDRKFMVPGEDPDDIFAGDLPRAYPPVIGE